MEIKIASPTEVSRKFRDKAHFKKVIINILLSVVFLIRLYTLKGKKSHFLHLLITCR